MNRMTPRSHQWISHLETQLTDEDRKTLIGSPRVAHLAEMLRRHGLVQTVLFLRSKNKEDQRILEILAGMIKYDHLGAELPLEGCALVKKLENPGQYLYYHELAIEAAVWLHRMTAAWSEEQPGKENKP